MYLPVSLIITAIVYKYRICIYIRGHEVPVCKTLDIDEFV